MVTKRAAQHTHNLVFGSHDRNEEDIAELGKTAVKGIVTVGTVGITAQVMGNILGGFQK